MSNDGQFLEHLKELLLPLGGCDLRRMFGGHGVYIDELMVGLVFDGKFFLKADEQTKPQFLSVGCTPFIYAGKGKPVEMGYWSVPDEALDSAAEMKRWAMLAQAAALRRRAAKVKAAVTVRKKGVAKK